MKHVYRGILRKKSYQVYRRIIKSFMELYQFLKKYLQGRNFVDLLVSTKAIILGSHEF